MIVVAIDGPSGVGKSTTSRALASRLGVPYLDTGAMYRAVGLAVRRAGIPLPLPDPDAVGRLAESVEVGVRPGPEGSRTTLGDEDVSAEIRSPEISRYASAVAAVPAVRRVLAARQRALALAAGGVLEGRDIATKVVPEAPFRFFLTASSEVRARRRHDELAAKGTPQQLDAVTAELVARDEADSSRADSPLVCDERYTVVDTSGLSAEEVTVLLEGLVRARLTAAEAATNIPGSGR